MYKIKNTSFEPIFILGLHRSGTTVLYKMLNETGNFNFLSLYHVKNFDRLIFNHINNLELKEREKINNLLKEKGIVNRKTDNIEVSSDYEHEYTYIFSERNYSSKINYRNKELFDILCKKLQYISDNNKPLLLKNPHDYPNFLLIKKIYPNAKFVFIHRNPLDVISSIMRLWNTRFKSKDEFLILYSKQYDKVYKNPLLLFVLKMYYTSKFPPGIFEVICHSKKASSYYLKNIKNLSKADYISIKYGDLCERPDEKIKAILDFLGLKTDMNFSGYIKPRKLQLLPEVILLKKFIYKKMKSYFEFFRYSI